MRISFTPMFNPFASESGRLRLGEDWEYLSGDKGTVEFRAHPATTDERKMGMWVRVCTGMMRFCVEHDNGEVRRVLGWGRMGF